MHRIGQLPRSSFKLQVASTFVPSRLCCQFLRPLDVKEEPYNQKMGLGVCAGLELYMLLHYTMIESNIPVFYAIPKNLWMNILQLVHILYLYFCILVCLCVCLHSLVEKCFLNIAASYCMIKEI
jgi:hypothetical protein